MIELAPQRHPGVRGLFADFPYLHGLVYGVLSGEYGQAFADRASDPTVGMLCDDEFVLFAGEADSATATEMIASRKRGDLLIAATESWRAAIRRTWGDRLQVKERTAFQPPDAWARARLRQQMAALPAGMDLKQVLPGDEARFAALSSSLVDVDSASGEPSLGGVVGFGVECEGEFVSGCAGFPAGGMMEFEVQTRPGYKRRGLATAAAAALIDYCLAHGLTPCWDAANDMSAGLAHKLGFANPARYPVYVIT